MTVMHYTVWYLRWLLVASIAVATILVVISL